MVKALEWVENKLYGGLRMYTLLRSMKLSDAILKQGPAFLFSFIIAEQFYKFHSFTFECLAFLATWFVVDYIVSIFPKNKGNAEK